MKASGAVTELVRSELKQVTRKRAVMILLCILAGFFALQAIGKPLLLPFRWGVGLEAPSAAYFADEASVIVDQTGGRLLFLDRNEQLCRTERLDSSSLIDNIAGVTYHGGSFYVWGSKMVKDSGYTKYDRILRYDKSGKYCETVYEADRTERNSERCLILDVDTDGKRLWITEILNDPHNYWDCGVHVLMQPLAASASADPLTALASSDFCGPAEVMYYEMVWVSYANYVPQDGSLYVTTNFGQLYHYAPGIAETVPFSETHYAKNILPLDADTIIWCESDTRSLYCNDTLLSANTNAYNNLAVDHDGFAYDDELTDCLHRVSLTGEEHGTLDFVPFSPVFGILTALRFAGPVFLLVSAAVWVISRSVRARKQRVGSLSQKVAMLLALFLIAGALSVFYTVQVVRAHKDARDNEITVMSRYFADTVDRSHLEGAVFRKAYLHDGEAYEQWKSDWGYFYDNFGDFRDREDPTAKAAYINFYQRVGDDYLCVYDSWTINPIGSKLVGSSASEERSSEIQVFRRASESIIYKTTPIYDGADAPVGLLLLGMDYQLTNSQIFAKCLDMTLTLTILFVTAFLLFTEGRRLIAGLRKKKEMQAQGVPNAELAVVRPLLFLFNLTSSFDGVILVLVAKGMLDSMQVSEAARLTLMAVPALVAGIGSILGLPLCNLLSSRVPVRKLTVCSCIVCMLAFVGMSFAVAGNLFVLFCLLKFCSSLVNSVLYGILSAIPLREEDEEKRYAILNDAEMGRISSTILGPLLGGVVAQLFRNEAIYLLNALSFLPVIALLLAAMPKNTCYTLKRKSLFAGKGFARFLFSVPTAAYLLLLVIPAMTIGGYKSYLFPIYLSAMDLPPIYITFFYALALTVAMLIITPITNALKDTDHWKKTVVTLLLIGTVFLGFAVNQTFYWAILILVINAVLEKLLKVSMAMLWPRQAKLHGLDLIPTSNVMSIFDQGAYALKETVLSLFLLLGNNFACIAVGGFCLICAVLFSLLTSRSAMAKQE